MLQRLFRILFAAGATLATSLTLVSDSRSLYNAPPGTFWVNGFSADLTQQDFINPSKSYTGKMYINLLREPRGMRMETTYSNRQDIFLWKQGQVTIYMDPIQKTYWKPEVKSSYSARITREDSPDIILNPGASSRYLGIEVLHGRKAKHWEITESLPDGRPRTWQYWEDVRLRSCLKSIEPGIRSFEMTNIREGSQPAHLFYIPDGFQKIPPPSS